MDNRYRCGCPGHGFCARSCNTGHYAQLNTYDYLADIPGNQEVTDLVEVQFKNTRKGYFHNINNLPLEKGDIVAVEAAAGHDIGTVSLTGKLVPLQMKKANLKSNEEIRRIYRKARPNDMERYEEAKSREHDTMIRSRQIAKDLGLNMKIGDVEYQGDGGKAIFYYIADGRVDFRQLIKVLAEAFKVRIEMKQIGARQEAGLIGGLGVCGRELCCANYITSFQSISTGAARCQDLSLNPQKLAGQCGKLKCCLNYEVANYLDAQSRIPKVTEPLEFEDGQAFLRKTDILREIMYFSYDRSSDAQLFPLDAAEVREIIKMNRNGIRPESLKTEPEPHIPEFITAVGDDSITRFDTPKRKKNRGKSDRNRGNKAERGKSESAASPERPERQDRPERGGSQERGERQDRGDRPNRKREGRGKPKDPKV